METKELSQRLGRFCASALGVAEEPDPYGMVAIDAVWLESVGALLAQAQDAIAAQPARLEALRLCEAVLAEHEQYDEGEPSRESEAAEAARDAIAQTES